MTTELFDLSWLDGALPGPALYGALALLALIDATSFGTLLIPIWLMLAPSRPRGTRILVYLGTIAGFYFVVGLLLAAGATSFMQPLGDFLETPAAHWLKLLVGAAMLTVALTMNTRKEPGSGALYRWRERVLAAESSGLRTGPETRAASVTGSEAEVGRVAGGSTAVVRRRGPMAALMMLALVAAVIEVASMVPYLAGIGLITTSGPGWPLNAAVLAAYCLVMVVPALVLLAGRLVAAPLVNPLLKRLNDWLGRTAAETTAWIVGIVGFLLARDGITRLGLFGSFLS